MNVPNEVRRLAYDSNYWDESIAIENWLDSLSDIDLAMLDRMVRKKYANALLDEFDEYYYMAPNGKSSAQPVEPKQGGGPPPSTNGKSSAQPVEPKQGGGPPPSTGEGDSGAGPQPKAPGGGQAAAGPQPKVAGNNGADAAAGVPAAPKGPVAVSLARMAPTNVRRQRRKYK